MKNADQKLILGIAIGVAAAVIFLPQMMAPGAGLPAGPKASTLPATAPRVGRRPYIRRGRAIIAQRPPTHNYLKQPGYPMPGWQV